ncbi:putative helicase [Bartonella silvatica]|uniref:Helicase n=1 Tax=Bartonella silvatica TaxID=357760 RepID=A0ABV2HIP8_9HYPH
MNNMIVFYNIEVKRFDDAYTHTDSKARTRDVDSFVNSDDSKISWSYSVKQQLIRRKIFEFEETCLTQSLYCPFTQQWLYYNRIFNEPVYQMPHIFPMGKIVENRVIKIAAVGARGGFSILMTKNVPDVGMINNSQCFPRYIYEDTTVSKSKSEKQSHLFTNSIEKSNNAGLQ